MISDFNRTDHLMGKLHRSLRRNYDRQLKNFGLTPCQFDVLLSPLIAENQRHMNVSLQINRF